MDFLDRTAAQNMDLLAGVVHGYSSFFYRIGSSNRPSKRFSSSPPYGIHPVEQLVILICTSLGRAAAKLKSTVHIYIYIMYICRHIPFATGTTQKNPKKLCCSPRDETAALCLASRAKALHATPCTSGLWLARNQGMEAYGSPYITHYNSFHFLFHSYPKPKTL